MFGSRKRLCHLARWMLALWLCALSLGAAHACLVAHQMHAAPAAVHCPPEPGQQGHEHAAGLADQHAQSQAAQLSCEKFCEGESAGAPSAASPLQQQPVPAAVLWLAPPPAPGLALQALRASTAATWPGQPLARPRMSVAIAFLRLTL